MSEPGPVRYPASPSAPAVAAQLSERRAATEKLSDDTRLAVEIRGLVGRGHVHEARERFSSRWPNFKVRSTLPHTPLIRIPLTLSAELRKNPVDVLHVQFTAPPFCPCPVVVSIHDLSFEHLPQTFNRRISLSVFG